MPSYTARNPFSNPSSSIYKCEFTWNPAIGGYHLKFDYHATLIETLKKLIPASHRSFDFDTKEWFIAEPFFKPMQNLIISVFGINSCKIVSRELFEADTSKNSNNNQQIITHVIKSNGSQALKFLELIGPLAAKKAYQIAATELHPDKQSGDASKMTELNVLWTEIQKLYIK